MLKTTNDVTLVLIRGNGSPRTFNLPLPKLRRNLLLLAGLVFGLATASLVLSILYLRGRYTVAPITQISEVDRQRLENTNELTEELAKAQAALEGRKKLVSEPGKKTDTPINMLSSVSSLAADPPVQINRPVIRRLENSRDVTIEFELQNRNPEQSRIRGYIVILAKTPSGVYAYPEGAFSIDENVILNFAKGETFGISRFRTTVATFSDLRAERGKLAFQIFVFSSTGEILNMLHVPEIT